MQDYVDMQGYSHMQVPNLRCQAAAVTLSMSILLRGLKIDADRTLPRVITRAGLVGVTSGRIKATG